MDGNTQLRIAHFLHKLIYDDDEYFDAADAMWLLDKIPAQRLKVRSAKLNFKGRRSGGFFGALTDTGHNAGGDDGEEYKKTLFDTEPHALWCGKYSVYRTGDIVVFGDRFRETRDDDGEYGEWSVVYLKGRPVFMTRAVQKVRSFTVPLFMTFTLSNIEHVRWKRPVTVCECV